MRGPQVLFVAILLALGLLLGAQAQPAGDEKEVTLTVQDQPVTDVAAQISEQSGVQVAVTENTEGTVSLGLDGVTVDEAVRALAEESVSSWVRAYLLEKQPPDEAYTAEELLEMLGEARTKFFDGLSDEERRELMAAWRDRLLPEGRPEGPEGEAPPPAEGEAPPRPQAERPAVRGGFGMRGFGGFGADTGGPGGGVAAMARPEGPPAAGGEGPPEGAGGPGGRGDFMRYEDPIRRLLLPARTEVVSLDLTGVPLEEALSAFTTETCFLVVAGEDSQGAVTVQVEEAPLSDALDAIAAAVGAEWRMVYVVGQPRELTEEEVAERQAGMEQRRERRFQQRWARFWQMSPEERAQSIQRRVDRVSNMRPERLERFKTRRGPRLLSRLTQYSATLSPDQRMEIKPLLQAVAKVMQ